MFAQFSVARCTTPIDGYTRSSRRSEQPTHQLAVECSNYVLTLPRPDRADYLQKLLWQRPRLAGEVVAILGNAFHAHQRATQRYNIDIENWAYQVALLMPFSPVWAVDASGRIWPNNAPPRPAGPPAPLR